MRRLGPLPFPTASSCTRGSNSSKGDDWRWTYVPNPAPKGRKKRAILLAAGTQKRSGWDLRKVAR